MTEYVFGYARYSSNNQREESAEAQINLISEYCKKKGYKVKEIFVDKAKTGTNADRVEFQRMIEAVKFAKKNDIPIDRVIVHKLDRFSRNQSDTYYYKNILEEYGAKLESVVENLDSDIPENTITQAVVIGMNEYYSKNLAREVRKGLMLNASKGMHNGGKLPLGYDLSPERSLIINEKEAESVKMIFELYSLGYGYVKIIKKLNKEGYYTKNGNVFSKNSLHSILTNEKYLGRYVYNKAERKIKGKRNSHKFKNNDEIVRIENHHPAIIEEDLFNRVQNKMKNKKQTNYGSKENYLLKGLLKCSVCGRHMTGSVTYSGRNKSKYSHYNCPNHKINCETKAVNRYYIEDYLIQFIKQFLCNDEILGEMLEEINIKANEVSANVVNKVELYKRRLEKIKRERGNLIRLASKVNDEESVEEIQTKLAQLANEQMNLNEQIQLQQSKANIKVTLEDMKKARESLEAFLTNPSQLEGRKFINELIEEVWVDNEVVNFGFKKITDKLNRLKLGTECEIVA